MLNISKFRAFAVWACPLLWWAIALISSILIGDTALRELGAKLHQSWLGYPGIVSVIAAIVAAVVLEARLFRGWSCEWVSPIVYVRWFMYGVSFVVGLLLWSGTTTSYDVPLWYRTVVIGVVIVPIIALLISHSMTSHWSLDESSGSRSLRWLGRIPLILFIMIAVGLLSLAVIEMFL